VLITLLSLAVVVALVGMVVAAELVVSAQAQDCLLLPVLITQ
jgi:hypothetical protein